MTKSPSASGNLEVGSRRQSARTRKVTGRLLATLPLPSQHAPRVWPEATSTTTKAFTLPRPHEDFLLQLLKKHLQCSHSTCHGYFDSPHRAWYTPRFSQTFLSTVSAQGRSHERCSFECCPNYSFHLNIKLGQLCPLFALTKFHFSASSVKKIILIVCINWLYVINNAISDVGPKNHIAHIAHVALRSSEVREPPNQIMNYFRKCQ